MSKFRNLKNNTIYTLEAIVTDATTNRNGNRVAIYKDALGTTYVRDLEEFEKKFAFVAESKWPNHKSFVTLHQIVLDGISRDLKNSQIIYETNYIADDEMIDYYRKNFSKDIAREQFERDCG